MKNLDEAAKEFWTGWKALHTAKGWVIGPDVGQSKMSPYLVRKWEDLSEAGQTYFKQLVAIALHAGGMTNESGLDASKLVPKLGSAVKAIKSGDVGKAEKKIIAAYRIAKSSGLNG